MNWHKTIGKALKEIRFVISGLNPPNSSAAQFIQKNYTLVRQSSPNFPFIVRECQGVDDFVVFQYEFGVERKLPLKELSPEQIEKLVETHISQAKSINSTV